MARIMTKCPTTGETVFTCQRMKPAEFDALERELGFRCPVCEQIHRWLKADAWLEESAPRSPTP
jgi:hypothetical protein